MKITQIVDVQLYHLGPRSYPVYLHRRTSYPSDDRSESSNRLMYYWLLGRGSIDKKPVICKSRDTHRLVIL